MSAQTKIIQDQARAEYKRGRYVKALELFKRAVGRSPSVELHDNCAACYEKLEDLDAARSHAKKAIQLAKEDPTGYVRAGQILIKQGRKSTALEIYAHGLKSVKHVGKGFEILKKVHRELRTELSPTKSVDPLTVLPRELAEQILNHLNFRQVMNTCLVSKQWAHFIRNTPNLWRHLDLTLAKRKVKNAFVSRAINTGRSKLTRASLNNLYDFDKALFAIARYCPLQELTLRNCGLLTKDIVDILKPLKTLKVLRVHKGTTMSWQTLSDVLQNAAGTLEVLYCENFCLENNSPFRFPQCDYPNLRNLDLTFAPLWPGLPELLHQDSLARMLNLESLKLHQDSNSAHPPGLSINMSQIDLTMLKHLSELDLLLKIPHAGSILLPSTLKSLAIATWQPQDAAFFADAQPLQWSLPFLEELRICTNEVPFNSFELALNTTTAPADSKPACLHTLSMAASDASDSLTKEALLHPRLAELKHLSLEGCYGVDDKHLAIVASTLPHLESLNVTATEVTGAGIKPIIINGLKKLVANDCRFIGVDAIHWARAQGVQVEHRDTSDLNATGGKKLRWLVN